MHMRCRSPVTVGLAAVACRTAVSAAWISVACISLGWIPSASIQAAEPEAAGPPALPLNFKVADVALGDRASGEPLTAESLNHRVVLLAFWNHECKECMASLPLFEQLHRSQGPAGLLVVGLHMKGGVPVDVRMAAEKAGATFPMVLKASVKGLDPPALPHAAVFDHTGGCIARGTVQEVADEVLAAVRAAPPLVLAGRHLEKLPALEKMLRDDSKFAAVLRKASESTESPDAATAEEAKFVLECLQKHADATITKAEELKLVDAYEASALLQRLPRSLSTGAWFKLGNRFPSQASPKAFSRLFRFAHLLTVSSASGKDAVQSHPEPSRAVQSRPELSRAV